MKTAVEWLADQIQKQVDIFCPGGVLDNNMIEQAKQMEKEQIIDFHVNCMEDGYNIETEKLLTENLKLDIKAHAEKYYNETFKSE